MPYTDKHGRNWTRSDDRLTLTSDDGRVVKGNAEMTDEYLAEVSYLEPTPIKTDAERIAELEAQLAAVLAKLSS